MLVYIVRRLLQLPIILFGISLLIFAMMSLLTPYERLALHLADGPERGNVDELVKIYGLDRPLPVQYWDWLTQVLSGDLGYSVIGKQPVTEALKQFYPASFELAAWTVLPIILVGVQLGVWSATHQDKIGDHVVRIFSLIGWSFPTYVFGLLALMIFYAKLDWFPAGRLSEEFLRDKTIIEYTRMYTIDSLLNGRLDMFWDALRHLILPVITLSYLSWALLLRVTRSSMLEALRQDYVTTARAKGLPEGVVVNKHVKRNALIPVVTIGGGVVVGLMNGVVITETVFNIRGLGWFFATAALSLDVISVMGFTLFNATLVVVGILIVDILYAVIDPRVRLA